MNYGEQSQDWLIYLLADFILSNSAKFEGVLMLCCIHYSIWLSVAVDTAGYLHTYCAWKKLRRRCCNKMRLIWVVLK